MSLPLPTDGFRWLEKHEIDQLFVKIMELGVNDEKGYILEVDLEMPKDKHDYFNHYPPAPQHVEVTEDMLSDFNIHCMEKLQLKHTKCTKLIPNLHHKEKYVVHYRALQCYMALGMELKAVHNRHHHFKFDNSTEHIYMCFANVLLLNFFSKLTNSSWMRINTNVNFVIKFSVMEKAEIGMRGFVYFSLFLSRVNVLREYFFLLYIYFLFFFN